LATNVQFSARWRDQAMIISIGRQEWRVGRELVVQESATEGQRDGQTGQHGHRRGGEVVGLARVLPG
jgi:hypothetical protein